MKFMKNMKPKEIQHFEFPCVNEKFTKDPSHCFFPSPPPFFLSNNSYTWSIYTSETYQIYEKHENQKPHTTQDTHQQ